MPKTPTETLGEPSLAGIRVGAPEVIDDDWKDDVVERLLRELKRQLIQLENTKPTTGTDEAPIRANNVQSLARIERTLTRLLQLHEQRELRHETKVAAENGDALRELERRIDRLIAAAEASEIKADSAGAEQ
jgi:hypothetical protein